MGYYDVSVLEAALNQKQCTLSWFDARRDIAECLSQQDESMVGLIVHVPTSPRWIPFWKGQHWFGILRLANGAFVDLDSRLSLPTAFAGFDDCVAFLNDILQNGGRLFLIHRDPEAVVASTDITSSEDPPRTQESPARQSTPLPDPEVS
ncbi:hypothetical protein BGZ70_007978 [Mortierella alpina]|uniref:ubiquitinyl hydrolase 1 n=1 Tax=Mortierella alpina TaxID=64518 RepID=A0A9P6JDM5_MORAP|nr:hypothetical protein BGZ70_007978 [Mortierella alpina]